MAKTYPKMIGMQWSMLDNFESTPSNYTKYNIPVWATEHKCGNYPWGPTGTGAKGCGLVSCASYVATAPNDQSYGVESWGYISSAIRAGVTAYNAWNMVTDGVGKGNDMVRDWAQDSLLTVSPSTCNGKKMGNVCATPAYFVFRHVSQYAQAGGTVLSTSGGDAVAFKNPDGSEVAVMYNSGSASTSYTVAIKGAKYSFSMPAAGWATVVVP
jgi:glucosylceramidase